MAVAAIKREKSQIEPAQVFDVYPHQIKLGRDQLLEGATVVFGEAARPEPEPTIDAKTLHAKIGIWRRRRVFCPGRDALHGERQRSGQTAQGSVAARKKMIDPTAKPGVSRQATVLGISRGSIYHQHRPVSDADLKLMHRTYTLHMGFRFAGSRILLGLLVQEGFKAVRLHVTTLMNRMGIEALYRKPNTLKLAPGHKIYPYLLRNLPISRPNQVWAMDITHIPMTRGFTTPAVVLDWFTRAVLSWRISITLKADFCIEAVEEALARHDRPEIFNTDQCNQFTSIDVIKVLASREIRISMDGKAAWRDNVFVVRLWRTLKYEEVYLRG